MPATPATPALWFAPYGESLQAPPISPFLLFSFSQILYFGNCAIREELPSRDVTSQVPMGMYVAMSIEFQTRSKASASPGIKLTANDGFNVPPTPRILMVQIKMLAYPSLLTPKCQKPRAMQACIMVSRVKTCDQLPPKSFKTT